MLQVRAAEPGALQAGLHQRGMLHARIAQSGVGEIGLVQHRALECGAGEIGAVQVGAGEVGLGEIGTCKVGAKEIGVREARAAQIRAGEAHVRKLHAGKVGARALRTAAFEPARVCPRASARWCRGRVVSPVAAPPAGFSMAHSPLPRTATFSRRAGSDRQVRVPNSDRTRGDQWCGGFLGDAVDDRGKALPHDVAGGRGAHGDETDKSDPHDLLLRDCRAHARPLTTARGFARCQPSHSGLRC